MYDVTGNTVSNVFLIIPPLVGAIIAYLDGMESRYVCCHLSLMGMPYFNCAIIEALALILV